MCISNSFSGLGVFSFAYVLLSKFLSLCMFIRSITAVVAPSESNDMRVQRCMDESPCEVERHGCADLSLPDLNWTRHDVEPRTGIKFPKLLDNILARGKNANKMSEVYIENFILVLYVLWIVFLQT